MKCAYCRKEIDLNSSVNLNGDYFCNNLCKYSFQHENNIKDDITTKKVSSSIPDNLKFIIDLPNFKIKKLIVQGSFYGYPKLFLDDIKLKSNGKNIFSRKRIYIVEDDDFRKNNIVIENRVLDAIPALTVNGNIVEIEKSLKWYEYIWIAIPSILFFIGGAIGAFIGFVGTYTNSVLFRKFNNKLVKYLLTGTNSFVAFILFFKIIVFIFPLMQEISFNYLQQPNNVEESLSNKSKTKFNFLTNQPWEFKGFYDNNGTDLTSPNSIIKNAKRYFYKNGTLSQVFFDGSVVNGKWSFSRNYDSLTVILGNEIITEKIINLTSTEFKLEYQNAQMIHIPYKFNLFDLL